MKRAEEEEVVEVVKEEEVEEEVIDFASLERELRRAVQQEEKGRRENAAKLRAVSQGAATTYQEFRDIVLACHLKPLDKKERGGAGRHTWNPLVSPSNRPPPPICALATAPHLSPSNHLAPSNDLPPHPSPSKHP